MPETPRSRLTFAREHMTDTAPVAQRHSTAGSGMCLTRLRGRMLDCAATTDTTTSTASVLARPLLYMRAWHVRAEVSPAITSQPRGRVSRGKRRRVRLAVYVWPDLVPGGMAVASVGGLVRSR